MQSYIITIFSIAILHAILPTHWLPFVLLGRGQKWDLKQTTMVALLVSLGHVAVTTILGFIAAWVGVEVFHSFEGFAEGFGGVVLILFGFAYIFNFKDCISTRHNRSSITCYRD